MFYLTKGFLKEATQRSSFYKSSGNNPTDDYPIIKLKNYERPVLVKVTNVTHHPSENICVLNVNDDDSNLDVCLDFSKWNLLSTKQTVKNDEKKIENGIVIIIFEYSFKEVKITGTSLEMMNIIECSIVGTIEFDQNQKQGIEQTNVASIKNLKLYSINQINVNLNNQNWAFKAKLLKISPLKEFINRLNGNNGKYIRLQFGDSTGFIEMVGFNDEINKVKDCIDDKFYMITNADIKNSKGTTQAWEDTGLPKIELIMTKKTIVEENKEFSESFRLYVKPKEILENDEKKVRNLLSLNLLMNKNDGDVISTMGIITQIEELKEITPKNKSPINIRNFYISDQTMTSVKVAIWGKQAEEFEHSVGNVLILARIKISLYNGMSLSVQRDTTIKKVEDETDHDANQI